MHQFWFSYILTVIQLCLFNLQYSITFSSAFRSNTRIRSVDSRSGRESHVCNNDYDCAPGLYCLPAKTMNPLAETGILGNLFPQLSNFLRSGLGLSNVLSGNICTRPKDFKESRKTKNKVERLDVYKPVNPKIQCRQIRTQVALHSEVTMSTVGTANSLFFLTTSVNENVQHVVKELKTDRLVPEAFTFVCDRSGDFRLSFKIMLFKNGQRISNTSKTCHIIIECIDPLETPMPPISTTLNAPLTTVNTQQVTTSTTTNTTTTAMKPFLIPKIQCLNLLTRLRIGSSISVSLLDSVYSVQISGGDISESTLETKIEYIPLMSDDVLVNMGESSSLVYRCNRRGHFLLNMAIAVLEKTSNMFDLKICPLRIDCIIKSPPIIQCIQPTFLYFGRSGSIIDVPMISTTLQQLQQSPFEGFFSATDADGRNITTVLTDSETGKSLKNLTHQCGAVPQLIKKKIKITALDGDLSSSKLFCGGHITTSLDGIHPMKTSTKSVVL